MASLENEQKNSKCQVLLIIRLIWAYCLLATLVWKNILSAKFCLLSTFAVFCPQRPDSKGLHFWYKRRHLLALANKPDLGDKFVHEITGHIKATAAVRNMPTKAS